MNEEVICLRDKIGEFLCEFAQNDSRIYVIDSDLAKSTKTIEFQNKYPERFVETGIAETSAMSIAAGLASEGQIQSSTTYLSIDCDMHATALT